MTENELSKIIVDCCYQIHVSLGPGLFESVYEEILYHELINRGLRVERQNLFLSFGRRLKWSKGFELISLLIIK